MFRSDVSFWTARVQHLDASYRACDRSATREIREIARGLRLPTTACLTDIERDNGLRVARERDQLLARRMATEMYLRTRQSFTAEYPGMVFFPLHDTPIGVDVGLFKREEPSRLHRLPGYWIDSEPVTNGAYEEVLGPRVRPVVAPHDDDPIITLNWFEAHRFCAAVGKRMPLRLEWEAAARGPDNYLFSTGPVFDPVTMRTWPSSGPRTLLKGDRDSGGLRDMAGNVWEWTWEIISHEFEPERYNYYNMIRGGSWRHCRSSTRVVSEMVNDLVQRSDNVGFRCALPEGSGS